MPTGKPWVKWVAIVLIACCIYALHTCKSKAENEPPEHHYGDDFETPNPSQGIYDVIESDEPYVTEDPILTLDPNITWQPIPSLTSTPDNPNNQPMPWNLKFDPFKVSYVLEDGEAVETWMRLNGANTIAYPPIATSLLHTVAASSYDYTEGDGAQWQAIYEYSLSTNGVNQANTWFRPGSGSLCYILYQNLSTSNSNRVLKSGDHIQFSFTPGIEMFSSIADEMYDPVVDLLVTFNYGTGPGTYIHETFKLSDRTFYFDYEVQPRLTGYLQSYQVKLVINPFSVDYPEPEDPTVIYWFDSAINGAVSIRYYRPQTWLDSVGGFISNGVSNITNFIQSIFVPNESQIQAWITSHSSDQLESGNPLNLVKDLFVSLMDKFSGYNSNISRPVVDVPALSFNVPGYGKVTPFEGYEWHVGSEGVIDGSGNNLWYYVKLSTSILICSGLIGKMWSWFKKWYDAHYAGDGGSE